MFRRVSDEWNGLRDQTVSGEIIRELSEDDQTDLYMKTIGRNK